MNYSRRQRRNKWNKTPLFAYSNIALYPFFFSTSPDKSIWRCRKEFLSLSLSLRPLSVSLSFPFIDLHLSVVYHLSNNYENAKTIKKKNNIRNKLFRPFGFRVNIVGVDVRLQCRVSRVFIIFS